MKYKIGTLAALLDIAPQTIRFYESCGILKSIREKGNNYRNFVDMDINSLLHLKASRKFGFSVQESAGLFNDLSHEEVCAMYAKREQTLAAEIEYQKQILACLEEMNRDIASYDKYLNRCEVAVRPAMYIIPYKKIDLDGTDKAEHNIDFKLLQYLYDKTPITTATPIILQEDMRQGCDTTYLGITFEARHSSYLDDFCIAAAKYSPEQLCVHTVAAVTNGNSGFQNVMNYVFPYIDSHNFEICGDVTASSHVGYRKSTTDDMIAHFWIPVKEISVFA